MYTKRAAFLLDRIVVQQMIKNAFMIYIMKPIWGGNVASAVVHVVIGSASHFKTYWTSVTDGVYKWRKFAIQISSGDPLELRAHLVWFGVWCALPS